jgi:hypothetical protein
MSRMNHAEAFQYILSLENGVFKCSYRYGTMNNLTCTSSQHNA